MPPSITRAVARRQRPTSRRFAALASTAAAVLGLGTLAAPALAEPGPGDADGGTTASGLTEYDAGRYVVLMSAPPAASNPGTRAPAGKQLNARSAKVRDYSARLQRQHQNLASDLGFDIEDSFTIAANGFVADLTADQATDLATDRRVLLVEKDSLHHADTWNTPDFLGMTGADGAWQAGGGREKAGDGIVIGVIDTGTWPESQSFRGTPLTKVANDKWGASISGTRTSMRRADGGTFRGVCETGEGWTLKMCTTKLIGARYYVEGFSQQRVMAADYLSPRDGNGHGSHTASTAGGNVVDDVTVEGREFGTLSGMAPAARIATYKALWETPSGGSGTTTDLVAAIEDAVVDGVDVINYSISGSQDTVLDAVEITFEGAAEAGVFVATSAGNNGPEASTVAHNSPWVTTVAAGTHFVAENTVVLGDGTELVGASISGTGVPSSPLVESSAVAAAGASEADATLCGPNSLDPAKVSGTIVVCTRGTYDRVAKSAEVERAGGVGMVLLNPGPGSLDADFHAVPTVHVAHTAADAIDGYLESAGAEATASIELGNLTGEETPLPQVAGFSSRGPAGSDNGDILKPDVIAPGASVLAAVAPPSNQGRSYDLYSGTSMSSPHIAGLAAFLQGIHPDWEPMRIKSAMMTTATDIKDADGGESRDLFAQGAGHVTPKKFLDPGLVVMSDKNEWRGYITHLGLDTGVPALEPNKVNLPSMAQGYVMSEASFTRTFTSTRAGSWTVDVDVPGFDGTASAGTVTAAGPDEEHELTFDFQRTDAPLAEWAFGYVTLTGPTTVRLPVALRPVSVKAPSKVDGSGVAGVVEVPITGGFTGDLAVSTAGLVKGQVAEGSLPETESTFECVTLSEDTDLAQFDLHAPDDTSDLDMYIYASDSCSTADVTAVAGEAATPAPGESFTLTDPEPGTYLVEVNAYAAGAQGSPVPYSLRVFDVGGAEEVGDLAIEPNPVPVETGVETSFEASWTGLDPAAHYLVVLGYDGAPNSTFLYVNTN